MSTSQATRTSRSFDAEALRRGVEERDAMTLLALYAEDAELHVADRRDAGPPGQLRAALFPPGHREVIVEAGGVPLGQEVFRQAP